MTAGADGTPDGADVGVHPAGHTGLARGTAWTMRLDMAEKARPSPDAEQGAGQVDLPRVGVGEGQDAGRRQGERPTR